MKWFKNIFTVNIVDSVSSMNIISLDVIFRVRFFTCPHTCAYQLALHTPYINRNHIIIWLSIANGTKEKTKHWMQQCEREYFVLQVRKREREYHIYTAHIQGNRKFNNIFPMFSSLFCIQVFNFWKPFEDFLEWFSLLYYLATLDSSLIPSFFSYQADGQFMVMLHQFTKSKARKREGENCLDHPFSFF